MFTNDSILLREYFLNRITLKNSTELQKLYNHFQSIKLTKINVNKSQTITKSEKIEINSDFGPERILQKTYILKKSSIEFTMHKTKCSINLYDSNQLACV